MIPTKYMEVSIEPIIYDTASIEHIPSICSSLVSNMRLIKEQTNFFLTNCQQNISMEMMYNIHRLNNPYTFVKDVLVAEHVSKSVPGAVPSAVPSAVPGAVTNSRDSADSDDSVDSVDSVDSDEHVFDPLFDQMFFVMIELCSTFGFLHTSICDSSSVIMYIGTNGKVFRDGIRFITKGSTGNESVVHTSTLDTMIDKLRVNDQTINTLKTRTIYFDIPVREDDAPHTILDMLKVLYIILNIRCTCVIKSGSIVFKPLLDILYILSGTYSHLYISNPVVSVDINEQYIICNNSYPNHASIEHITTTNSTLLDIIDGLNVLSAAPPHVTSLIHSNMSQHFLNKMEESTLVVGQKTIEYYENLMALLKIVSKEDKLDTVRKNAMSKCIQWCTKHNVSHIS